MKKPTVLHTEESNGWGGQEIRILHEMLGIKGRGYKVILATPSHTNIFERANKAGIETFDVRMNKSDLLKGAFELAKIIREQKVSIINTHSSKDSWMGSIAGRFSGVKIIRTRHISSELNKSPMTRLVYGPLCDAIITTGDFIKNQLIAGLRLPGDKIVSIPTGIDTEKFSSANGDRIRSELGFQPYPDDIIIGSAAALRSWKGHEYLVKAMPILLRDYPDIKMVFAGEGPMRAAIEGWIDEAGVGKSVFLLGHREDVADVIKSFDISLLASYASEGIPQFVLQSMAAGKAVIGTTAGGIPEVVRDGVNGLVVPPRDPEAIAGAVKKIISTSGLKEKMGEAGRVMALEKHSTKNMLDDLELLYGKILYNN